MQRPPNLCLWESQRPFQWSFMLHPPVLRHDVSVSRVGAFKATYPQSQQGLGALKRETNKGLFEQWFQHVWTSWNPALLPCFSVTRLFLKRVSGLLFGHLRALGSLLQVNDRLRRTAALSESLTKRSPCGVSLREVETREGNGTELKLQSDPRSKRADILLRRQDAF